MENDDSDFAGFPQALAACENAFLEGGAGGGSAQSAALLKALQGALDGLLANQQCAGTFGKAPGLFSTSSTPTAGQVLDSLISASKGGAASPYGSIQFVDPDNPSGIMQKSFILSGNPAETVATSPFWHSFPLWRFASASNVYINTLDAQGYFNFSTATAELTILHELGHVLANQNWKGDQIGTDANNPNQNNINDALIEKNCGLKP